MDFVWGMITGIVISIVVCLLWPKKSQPGAGDIGGNEVEKQANLQEIEDYIAGKDQFTNDDIEELLGVSDTTVGRYLQGLEDEGKIKQVGKTGRSVFYEKNE